MERLREVVVFVLRSGKRIAVLVLGMALLGVGLVMMITPGPGLLAIVAGLAVLATEFTWAQHMLEAAKDKAGQAKDALRRKGRS